MSADVITNIVLLGVAVLLVIPKRTRPLVTVVAVAWLVKQAVLFHQDGDSSMVWGCVIAVLSLIANWIIYREKYVKELKG